MMMMMMMKCSTVILLAGTSAMAQRNVDPGFGVDEPFYCGLNSDCWDDEYCLKGVCATHGMCLEDYDCVNPYNTIQQDTKCVGYLYCNTDTNTCARHCGDGQCPDGTNQKMCLPGKTGCDTYDGMPPDGAILCVNNSCNNCNAIWYNSAGYVVDYDVDPEFGVDPIVPPTMVDPDFGVDPIVPPMVDPDFGVDAPVDPGFGVDAPVDPGFGVDAPGASQYCMDGLCPVGNGAYCDDDGNCLLLGKCTTKDDCFSIYNDPYPVSMCVGDIVCHNGLCVNDCDPIFDQFDCSNKDNAPNVVDVVCKDEELSTLCAALKDTSKNKEVNKWLTDPEKRYTLFAPINKAFQNVPENYDANLKFHIAKGRASFARDLSCIAGNNLVTMANGKDSRTKCKKEVPYIQQGKGNTEMDIYPEFIESDIVACNGLIHKISNVMLLNPKN